MDTGKLLETFTSAVEAREGERFAELFTPDGTYDDIFYGLHRGRTAIARMINEQFYEYAEDFRWDMIDPVREGDMIYARCVFSYVSRMPGAAKPRIVMESVAMLRLKDGLIDQYSEVVNNGPALVELGLSPEHVVKIMARQTKALKAREEARRHLA
ncbi:MAG: nuclear transport factor 2 family protein [Flavobacteriaceae bacterium]